MAGGGAGGQEGEDPGQQDGAEWRQGAAAGGQSGAGAVLGEAVARRRARGIMLGRGVLGGLQYITMQGRAGQGWQCSCAVQSSAV
jgi:hypothetical protein